MIEIPVRTLLLVRKTLSDAKSQQIGITKTMTHNEIIKLNLFLPLQNSV